MSGDLPLWHYTTAATLLRILEGTEVYATSFQHLSDASEITYARKVLGELLREEIDGATAYTGEGTAPSPGWRRAKEWLDAVEAVPIPSLDGDIDAEGIVGIFSLSEDGDLLSQWRAYGGAAGVAIGFRPRDLEAALKGDMSLRECVYEREDARKGLAPLVGRLLAEIRDPGPFFANSGRREYFKLAPTVKHPKFKEEREWRVITERVRPSDFKVRATSDRVIPYVPIQLVERLESPPHLPRWTDVISEVRVGPARHTELTVKAIEPILKRHHMIKVSVSDIPFRPL